jgi:hypothetical protein
LTALHAQRSEDSVRLGDDTAIVEQVVCKIVYAIIEVFGRKRREVDKLKAENWMYYWQDEASCCKYKFCTLEDSDGRASSRSDQSIKNLLAH